MANQKHTQDPLDLDEAMSASEAFIIKYKNKFLIGIAAIVIVVGGILGYKHFISEPGFDIESLDGEIVAECFAVTMAASNGKLKKDSEKLMLKAEGRKTGEYLKLKKGICGRKQKQMPKSGSILSDLFWDS